MLKIIEKKRRDPHPICRRSVEDSLAVPLGHGANGLPGRIVGNTKIRIPRKIKTLKHFLKQIFYTGLSRPYRRKIVKSNFLGDYQARNYSDIHLREGDYKVD